MQEKPSLKVGFSRHAVRRAIPQAGWGQTMARLAPLICGLLLLCATAAAAASPRDTVEQLHAALLDIMRDAVTLGVQGRYERLQPILPDLFDFERMTQVVVGGEWRDLSPDQRRATVEAFADFSIATYASRFDGYSGERFETVADTAGPRGTILVRTQLIRPEDEPVDLTYLMAQTDGDWRIIDVFFEGTISETARLRSEFRATIQRGGVEELINRLREKSRALVDPAE